MKPDILLLGLAAILLFSGCVSSGNEGNTGLVPENHESQPAENNAGGQDENTGIGNGAGGTAAEAALELQEWKAPDGSITLQVPAGWIAAEKKVDNCTVNWSVEDPTATKSAYMTNQAMVFKSEEAREMYRLYGLQGIDNVPVSGYLNAEEAVSQVIAPLTGSSNVKIVERDDGMSAIFSQALCIAGLAACDALVFDATYDNKGTAMKGKYFVQTFDLGEGTTWWINIWGYTSPAAEWENSRLLLEKIFTSVKYTDDWAAKCGENTETTAGIIKEVIKKRQEAAENTAEQWDQYVTGQTGD